MDPTEDLTEPDETTETEPVEENEEDETEEGLHDEPGQEDEEELKIELGEGKEPMETSPEIVEDLPATQSLTSNPVVILILLLLFLVIFGLLIIFIRSYPVTTAIIAAVVGFLAFGGLFDVTNTIKSLLLQWLQKQESTVQTLYQDWETGRIALIASLNSNSTILKKSGSRAEKLAKVAATAGTVLGFIPFTAEVGGIIGAAAGVVGLAGKAAVQGAESYYGDQDERLLTSASLKIMVEKDKAKLWTMLQTFRKIERGLGSLKIFAWMWVDKSRAILKQNLPDTSQNIEDTLSKTSSINKILMITSSGKDLEKSQMGQFAKQMEDEKTQVKGHKVSLCDEISWLHPS